MVFLTLATLLLLVVCAVQFAVAPSTARRFVRRRLSSPIDYEAGAHVHAALVRRTRVQTLGGAAGGVVALGGAHAREHRHKGLAERPFGKQAAKHIGNAERDVEGVGHGRGSEHGGHQQLAHQTRDARGQGQQGNG